MFIAMRKKKSLYHPLWEVCPDLCSDRNQTGWPLILKPLIWDILWQIKYKMFLKLIMEYNSYYSLFINIEENIYFYKVHKKGNLSWVTGL